MKIQKLLDHLKQSEIFSIESDAAISEAAGLLNAKRVGALLVVDREGDFHGILSERDVLYACEYPPEQLAALRVKDVMTPRKDVITLTPGDKLNDALQVMLKHKIRHLPIVSDDGQPGQPVGILSMRDVVRKLWHETRYKNQALQRYIGKVTLSTAPDTTVSTGPNT